MDLELSESPGGGFAVLGVSGELDVYTAPRLRQGIVELLTAGRSRIIVDLARVEFIDSTGLGVLVGALKRIRQSCQESSSWWASGPAFTRPSRSRA